MSIINPSIGQRVTITFDPTLVLWYDHILGGRAEQAKKLWLDGVITGVVTKEFPTDSFEGFLSRWIISPDNPNDTISWVTIDKFPPSSGGCGYGYDKNHETYHFSADYATCSFLCTDVQIVID